MASDYYDLLGVSKSATADEIRTAYRKLARQYHPDVNKAPEAQKKFTEVQQAYDVLSDEQKRKLYDQFGSAAFETGGAAAAGGRAGAGAGPHYSWSNVGGQGRPAGAGFGGEFDNDEVGSVFEAIFGNKGESPFGRAGQGRPRPRGRATPEEVRQDITVDFLTAARGGVERLRVSESGRAKTIEVTIAAGTEEGAQLRVRGGAGPQRDLILRVHITPHALIRRGEGADIGKGLDLTIELPLTIAEATLGATISVPTLTGPVDLQVPPGTPSGQRLRLRSKGIHDAEGRQGNLYVVTKIVVPPGKELTPPEQESLRQLADRFPSPRTDPTWSGSL